MPSQIKLGEPSSRPPRFITLEVLMIAGIGLAVVILLSILSRAQQHVTIRDPQGNVLISGYQTVDPVSVSVSPQTATLTSGQTQTFTASVQNSLNTVVAWTASAGAIDSAGNFVAPAVAQSTLVTVTATSQADATKFAVAAVTVNPQPQPVSVVIIPTTSTLLAGSAQQFTAVVSNAANQSVTWSATGMGSVNAAGLFTAGGVAGSATVTATSVQDATKSATATITVNAPPPPPPPTTGFDGPAELPRVYLSTDLASTPTPGATTLVPATANLQSYINAANCGDRLMLSVGASYPGVLAFPNKPCDDGHWIQIRSAASDASLPPEHMRILPCYFGVASLPGRPAFSCPNGVVSVGAQITVNVGNISGPIVLANGANHYRIGPGVEITRGGTGINYQLLGVPGTTADKVYLDRVYLHGIPVEETKNGLNWSGMTNGALIDSYASEFHCTSSVGSCTDAKVIGGANSNYPGGPFKVVNNFMEASGENLLLGGGTATTTPADIEIRHNHFFKPLIWLPGQPGFQGGASGHPFMVKNLLELKNAQRVLVEGNIFEYTWGGFSQPGYMLLLAPKNQAGGCPICVVTDVTIRYNTFSHAGGGFQIENVPDDNGAIGKDGERYSIHDVTLDDINANFYAASAGSSNGNLFQVISEWPVSGQIQHLWINHITGFSDPARKFVALSNNAAYPKMADFKVTNSIIGQAGYWVWSSTGSATDCSVSNNPLTALTSCFSTYSFDHNALINIGAGRCGGSSVCAQSAWPPGSFFPGSPSAVGFANFNNGNGGDYTLTSGPYIGAGSDGKNLGADIAAIQKATAGAQ